MSKKQTNLISDDTYYILVDMSYMIFYRFHALCRWWKLAKQDIPLPNNPSECDEFVDKFISIFSKIKETIVKKLNIHKGYYYKFICAKDCPRNNIWRNTYYNKYKENRDKDDSFMVGKFFELIYKDDFLKKIGFDILFEYDKLEADDIIAITKNYIRHKYPLNKTNNVNIIIIGNDHDYLQLMDEKTELVNLAFKYVSRDIKIYKSAEKNLLFKILMGDKSDNILQVFPKLTKKNLDEYLEDKTKLEEDLIKQDLVNKFNLNSLIIDFKNIPDELVKSFILTYKLILELI